MCIRDSLNRDYPGNIRELENILEHALIISQEKEILPQHLPDYVMRTVQGEKTSANTMRGAVDDLHAAERKKIIKILATHNGNRSRAAKDLGIDRTTLWRKMKRYGMLR